MKKIYFVLGLLFIGCYTDDNENITSEDAAHNTSELTSIMKSITLHNGAFDDKIDNTNCLSLLFPYQIYVNSELQSIASVEDISALEDSDVIEIVYPITTISYNYQENIVVSPLALNSMTSSCEMDFNLTHNECLDFQYPINIKKYNEVTTNFETLQLMSDKEVFTYLDNLHATDVYQIDYPIFISDNETNSIRVNSNLDFISILNTASGTCN